MRFGSFFMAEYINMIIIAGVATTMFLGGWHGFGPAWLGPFWVLLKMLAFLVLFVWVRATLPRLRYDQLMSFGWKVLLPLATLNALVTAILVVTARGAHEPPYNPSERRRWPCSAGRRSRAARAAASTAPSARPCAAFARPSAGSSRVR